jgi:hypothetical protein
MEHLDHRDGQCPTHHLGGFEGRDRPLRTREKTTKISPTVATTSERKWAGDARLCAEMLTAAFENMRLATTAPPMHPTTWTGRYATAARQLTPPKMASTNDTTGLKCAPDTGPNIKMMA